MCVCVCVYFSIYNNHKLCKITLLNLTVIHQQSLKKKKTKKWHPILIITNKSSSIFSHIDKLFLFILSILGCFIFKLFGHITKLRSQLFLYQIFYQRITCSFYVTSNLPESSRLYTNRKFVNYKLLNANTGTSTFVQVVFFKIYLMLITYNLLYLSLI